MSSSLFSMHGRETCGRSIFRSLHRRLGKFPDCPEATSVVKGETFIPVWASGFQLSTNPDQSPQWAPSRHDAATALLHRRMVLVSRGGEVPGFLQPRWLKGILWAPKYEFLISRFQQAIAWKWLEIKAYCKWKTVSIRPKVCDGITVTLLLLSRFFSLLLPSSLFESRPLFCILH